MDVKRIQQLYSYNPSKGIIKEAYGDVDTSKYICIGEVENYFPWTNEQGKNKLYIMGSPNKIMRWGKEMFDIRYTENQDGSGRQMDSLPAEAKQRIVIYPNHQDDEYGVMFLGKKQDKEVLMQKHQDFISRLFKFEGKIVIHHNTSFKITDGFVKKGKPNGWSNNTDKGIYFWGSRNSGKDPSNAGLYTYYCLINGEDLYDFETNDKRLTLEQAMRKYGYVGQNWQDEEAIVVNTSLPTPIWRILDKQTGIWYDKDWNQVEKPF